MRSSQPWKTNRARILRANAPSAEDVLWSHLRNRQLGGFKFVRQAPVDCYFADFLCRASMLIVEVDGATHGEDDEIANDAKRSARLETLGYKIVRIFNGDVFSNIDGVLEELLAILEGRLV